MPGGSHDGYPLYGNTRGCDSVSEHGSGDDAAQALQAIEQREVALAGAEDAIIAVRVQSGDIYVPLRSVCERLGIEPQAQTRRIRRDEVLAEGLRPVQVETKGGLQTLLCLELEGVPLWLAGIEPARVRENLRERLRVYKRWVRRRVYEAFMTETGLTVSSSSEALSPSGEDASPLDQIEAFGLALAAFARQQRAFEQRYAADQAAVSARLAHLDTRLDRAAEAFAHLMREVQVRLDGADVITDAQATEIKAAVQTIAHEMQRRGTPGNPYQGIWNELFRRFRVPSYARIKISQYPAVMAWLDTQIQALGAEGNEGNAASTGQDGERQHGAAP